MGNSSLLSKAITINNNIDTDFLENPLLLLRGINQGVNAPFRIFNLICNQMKLNHAVLLMNDPINKKFFPIVYKNFDRTSAMRLQIPFNTIDGLKDKSRQIQRFFSYADSQIIHDYGLIELLADKNRFFLIHTTIKEDAPHLCQNSFLHQNIKLITDKLNNCNSITHSNQIRTIGPLFLISANHFIKTKNSKNHSLYLFFIDSKETLERIIFMEGGKAIDCFKTESQCYEILSNNIEDWGQITRINFGEYLILAHLDNSHSPHLLKEHFTQSLSSSFEMGKKCKPMKIKFSKYFKSVSTLSKAAKLILTQQ